MDPRYRFTIVISTLLVVWWLWVVISTYLFGNTGLNMVRYQIGIVLVGASVLGGFFSVWLAYRLILWQRSGKTGFEAEPTDEFGTAFSMVGIGGKSAPYHIALSKFQPSLIAPPLTDPSLHPLEAELIGFLQGYRHWPVDLKTPEMSLYEDGLSRWQAAKALPGSTPLLRVAALATNLCCVHAYEERRTSAPWWQLFARDSITFRLRTEPRAGMSALLLSTMPAFRAMAATPEGQTAQRSLLAALRYHHTPQNLPLNAGGLATQLIEGLQRTELSIQNIDRSTLDELNPARRAELLETLPKLWLATLGVQSPETKLSPTTTLLVHLGQAPSAWLQLEALLVSLGQQLEPTLRHILNLWEPADTKGIQHPAWGHLLPLLQEAELIKPEHAGVNALAGTFMLQTPEGAAWGPAVKLNLEHPTLTTMLTNWKALPPSPTAPELALEPEMLRARATLQLQQLEGKLREMF